MGIWEVLIIVGVIVLLFSGKRLARLGQAFRRSKTGYKEGLEEPVDAEFKDVSEGSEKVERRK